ncbi:MAG: protein kinase [Cyanobacteria bacterium P01_F01_bin.53]
MSDNSVNGSRLLNHRYKILRALAEGGFGKTFLAEDIQMPSQRRCVIKQLKPLSAQPEIAQIVQQRFIREAAVLDAVGKGHGQIPTLYDYFSAKGQFYLVQEWIAGEPLCVTPHAVWPEEKVCGLLCDLLPAIAYVHSKNVIHRDIKPANIIIRTSDNLPCLIDFGAVKELMTTIISPSGLPKSSIVIGTAGYMSPEQAAGHPTFVSDLYSLGLTAIGLLTGKTPSEIPNHSHTGQLLWKQYVPTISEDLAEGLSKAVRAYPQNRYSSAVDMLTALSPTATKTAVSFLPETSLDISSQATIESTTKSLETDSFPIRTVAIASDTVIQRVDSPERVSGSCESSFSSVSSSRTPLLMQAVAMITAACTLGSIVAFMGSRTKSDVASVVFSGNSRDNQQEIETTSNSHGGLVPSANEKLEQPTTATEFTNRAVLFYNQGRLMQARQDVDSALAITPDAVEALILKGDISVSQSRVDFPGAIAAYTQALTLSSDNVEILEKRCKAHQNDKAWDLAHQDCSTLLSLEPQNANFYDRRGDIRSAQKNYQGAIADYTQAIEINEANGNAAANQPIYWSRAQAYNAAGEPEKGLTDLESFRSP